MKKTQSTKPVSEKAIAREWHVIDVTNKALGRVSNEIARLLQGKQKVMYSPHLDVGDYVVVINAKQVSVSGHKADEKVYAYYSGYPGGLKQVSYKAMMEKKPSEVIRHAVSGMLPKNKLRDRRLTRLFVYSDDQHPYKDKVK